MHETGGRSFDCFSGAFYFFFGFWPDLVCNFIRSALPLLSFSFPSFPASRTGIDFGSTDLGSPWLVDES